MARIEIDSEEYNNLVKRLNEVEAKNAQLTKENNSLKDTIFDFKRELEYIANANIIKRLFCWVYYAHDIHTTIKDNGF